MRPRPQRSTLFPYTTLFRSNGKRKGREGREGAAKTKRRSVSRSRPTRVRHLLRGQQGEDQSGSDRSEEHTSELQSRFDIVCRLLLEKKKVDIYRNTRIIRLK